MKKTRNLLKRIIAVTAAMCTVWMLATVAFAEGSGNAVMDSTLVQGALKLIGDVGKVAAVAAIPITGLVVGFCQIRKAMSDEQDEKQWNKWTKRALVAGVICICAGSMVSIIFGYFS